MQTLNHNSSLGSFLTTHFSSENLQNLFFGFGFFFVINFLDKVCTYLPYQVYGLKNLEFNKSKLNGRYISLRVSIVGIGTFIFVLDVILENVLGVSLNRIFETIENGIFFELYDLVLNVTCSSVLLLMISLASGWLYMQRTNWVQFTKVLKQNSCVLCQYVREKWEIIVSGECAQVYLAQTAWNTGIIKITFYIMLIIGCSCLLGGLLPGLRDINWPFLVLLAGSLNDVISNVGFFYGNRKISNFKKFEVFL